MDFAGQEILAGKLAAMMVVVPGCAMYSRSRKETMNCSWAEVLSANGITAVGKWSAEFFIAQISYP